MSLISLITKIQKVKKDERRNVTQIKELQKQRFQKLLRYVLKNSKFYRDYYGGFGITLEKIDSLKLSDLPTINKQLMMEHYDDFVCDPALKLKELEKFISNPKNRRTKYKKKYQVIHTSGSTGRIGIFVYGEQDWEWLKAIVLTRISKSKINLFKKTKLAFIGATDGHYAGVSLATDAPRALFKFLKLDINRPFEEMMQQINDFQPDMLSGYASGMYLLAQEQQKGTIKIKPRRIMCSADPLLPNIRKTVIKTFGINPINFYAASESIGMAAECGKHDGMHLFTDWHMFEIVDDQGKPTPAGQSGKLILTNLYNYTQPLIRYEMNDQIIQDPKKCSCNWSFPKIKNVAGRQEEFLWFKKPDGGKEFLHPLMITEFFVPGLEKLQIEQKNLESFIMRCVIDGDPKKTEPAIRKRMDEILKGKGLKGLTDYNIQFVKNIPNDPKTGKFKLILKPSVNKL